MQRNFVTCILLHVSCFNLLLSDVPDVITDFPVQYYFVNDTLTLSCYFDGVPTPSVVWTQNDTAIDVSNPKVSVNSSNSSTTLTIQESNLDWSGVYSCDVSNVEGSRRINITVFVVECKY